MLLAAVSAALWQPAQEEEQQSPKAVALLLVDFEQFFDTIRPERLYKKMRVASVPMELVSLLRELCATHYAKVRFKSETSSKIKVQVGVPQGSGWSPELASLYVDVGLADKLIEHSEGLVQIGGLDMKLLMYADDLVVANKTQTGVQQQFGKIENCAEEDGIRVSYKKTQLVVFRGLGAAEEAWVIQGRRGDIRENGDGCVKYLVFF